MVIKMLDCAHKAGWAVNFLILTPCRPSNSDSYPSLGEITKTLNKKEKVAFYILTSETRAFLHQCTLRHLIFSIDKLVAISVTLLGCLLLAIRENLKLSIEKEDQQFYPSNKLKPINCWMPVKANFESVRNCK